MGKRRQQNATLAMPQAHPGRGGSGEISRMRRIRETVSRVEREDANRAIERATLIGREGEVLSQWEGHVAGYNKAGSPLSQVEIPEEEFSKLEGATFTHNHPAGTSFSRLDILIAMEGSVAEMRAAGRHYRYSFRPPRNFYRERDGSIREQHPGAMWRHGILDHIKADGTPSFRTPPLKDLYDQAKRDVERTQRERIRRGEISPAEDRFSYQHEVTKAFVAMTRDATHGAVYRFSRWPAGTRLGPFEPRAFDHNNALLQPPPAYIQEDWSPEKGLPGMYGYGPGRTGPDGKKWR